MSQRHDKKFKLTDKKIKKWSQTSTESRCGRANIYQCPFLQEKKIRII